MANYRPKGLGLERVLGSGALFAAAYGNVGSSIYYALGLVAAFALGLTPIVYILAGGLFVATAMTYTEAASNFPEAGGSSSFARRAFNELVSFIAAWGQMLNYIITVAISAFFVPHYLGVFWEPLRHSPGDIIGGIVIVILLSLVNVIGVRESGRLNLLLAVIDFATQLLLLMLGVFLVLNFDTLIHNIHLGRGAAVGRLLSLDHGRDDLLHGNRDDCQHGGGGARAPPPDPAFDALRGAGGDGDLHRTAGRRPLGDAGHGDRLRLFDAARGQYAGDPILGVVANMNLGAFQTAMEYYVGILAGTILLIASNAGSSVSAVSRTRWAVPAASRQAAADQPALQDSGGRHRGLRPDRLHRDASRSGGVPRHALRVRGHALVHDRARLADRAAMAPLPQSHARLPGDVEVESEEAVVPRSLNLRFRASTCPMFAVIGGLGTFAAWIAVMALYSDALIVGTIWMLLGPCELHVSAAARGSR